MAGLRVSERAVSGRRRDTHPSVAARVPRLLRRRLVAVRGAGIESSMLCGSRQTRDFAIPKSVFVVDHSPRTVANHGVQLHVRAERPSAVLPVASRACSRSAPAQRIVRFHHGQMCCAPLSDFILRGTSPGPKGFWRKGSIYSAPSGLIPMVGRTRWTGCVSNSIPTATSRRLLQHDEPSR